MPAASKAPARLVASDADARPSDDELWRAVLDWSRGDGRKQGWIR